MPIRILCLFIFFLTGCQISQADREGLMSYVECASAEVCTIRGDLTIKEVNHVKMGRLNLENGRCVNVSLPSRLIRKVLTVGAMAYTAQGQVFPGSWDENMTKLIVNGRRIGVSQCGEFYVFVQ